MKETVQLTVNRYRTSEGKPTCACDFSKNEVCEFYRTQRFGMSETCLFAPDSYNGYKENMNREGKDQLGFLIPGSWCPLFKE